MNISDSMCGRGVYMFSLVQLNTIYWIHELIKIIFYTITGCVSILIAKYALPT